MSKRVDRGCGGVGGFPLGRGRGGGFCGVHWVWVETPPRLVLRQVEDRKDITVNVLQKDRHQEGPC